MRMFMGVFLEGYLSKTWRRPWIIRVASFDMALRAKLRMRRFS